jgi:hypothetical protein
MEYLVFKMIIDSSKGKYEFIIAGNGLSRIPFYQEMK